MTEALLALGAFVVLAFLRVPMAFAMGFVGFVGTAWKLNFNVAAQMVGTISYETGLAYGLSVIPLFILMGNFVVRARMSEELFQAAHAFIGHWRGGLAMSTIVASGARHAAASGRPAIEQVSRGPRRGTLQKAGLEGQQAWALRGPADGQQRPA